MITVLLSLIVGTELGLCLQVHKCCSQDQLLTAKMNTCFPIINETCIQSDSSFLQSEIQLLLVDDTFNNLIVSASEVYVSDRIEFMENDSLSVNFDSKMNQSHIFYSCGSHCLDRVSLDSNLNQDKKMNANYSIIISHPCLFRQCQRICCHRNMLWNRSECQILWNSSIGTSKIYDNNIDFEVITGLFHCENHRYKAQFLILPNNDGRPEGNKRVSLENCCIFRVKMGDSFESRLMHWPMRTSYFEDTLYKLYFVAGSVFLAATLLVYILVRELRRTMYSWIMMSHVGCMFICYSTMAFDKIMKPQKHSTLCTSSAYITQFSFIAAMLWLNVMCIYINRSFSILNTGNFNRNISRVKIYVLYSVYVEAVTAGISCFTFISDNTHFLEDTLKPKIGKELCWFADRRAKFLYFYLPVTLILVANFVLFMHTFKKILRVQTESKKIINRDSKKHKGNKPIAATSYNVYDKIMLCAKLCALMGITWIFEILSWAVGGPDYYWYFTDAINSLRGVFIFFICCCKKKVFKLLFKPCRKNTKVYVESFPGNRPPFSTSATKSRL